MARTHDLGDLVRLTGTFTDSADAPIDPATVIVKYKKPGGTTVTKTYDTDPEVVKDGTGVYHMDVDADEAGVWTYRWESTGTGQAAEETEFYVSPSVFS